MPILANLKWSVIMFQRKYKTRVCDLISSKMAEEFTYQVDFFLLELCGYMHTIFFFCLDFYPVALLSYFPLVFFLVKKNNNKKQVNQVQHTRND